MYLALLLLVVYRWGCWRRLHSYFFVDSWWHFCLLASHFSCGSCFWIPKAHSLFYTLWLTHFSSPRLSIESTVSISSHTKQDIPYPWMCMSCYTWSPLKQSPVTKSNSAPLISSVSYPFFGNLESSEPRPTWIIPLSLHKPFIHVTPTCRVRTHFLVVKELEVVWLMYRQFSSTSLNIIRNPVVM